jgi:hypothetical protein
MIFFNPDIPIISRKQSEGDVQPLPGIWYVRWRIKHRTLFSSFYTRHDQACLLWSVLTATIFLVAQFLPMSWMTQAIAASVLTVIGTLGMVFLTGYLMQEKRLAIILCSWICLMLIGSGLTLFSLLLGWPLIMVNLCLIWLALTALGYFITAVGMRSRALFLCSILHLLAILGLPLISKWQPLFTGGIIAGTVFLLAELQWDSNGICNYLMQTSDLRHSSK